MESLNFRPARQPGESLSSLMIRASQPHNMTPGQMLGSFNQTASISAQYRRALAGDHVVISKILNESGWEPSAFMRRIATEKGFGGWINFSKVSVCPKCTAAGYTLEIHDLAVVESCPLHGCTLQSTCTDCGRYISANRSRLDRCQCGSAFPPASEAQSHTVKHSEYIQHYIEEDEPEILEAFIETYELLRGRYDLQYIEVSKIDEFVRGNAAALIHSIRLIAEKLASLPIRATIAPLASAHSPIIKINARKLLDLFDPTELEVTGESSSSFYLNKRELDFALGLKSASCTSIMRAAFEYERGSSLRNRKFGSGEIALFYSKLAPKAGLNGVDPEHRYGLYQYCSLTKKSVPSVILEIIKGRHVVVALPQKESLSSILLGCESALVGSAPTGYLTLRETVDYLGSYEEAVRSARDSGLLPAIHQLECNNRYIFLKDDLDLFISKYATIGELARDLGTKSKRLSDQLQACGVSPVSGPNTDGGAAYIYLRKDLANLELAEIANMKEYPTTSGRKQKGSASFDGEKWATASEVSHLLGIPTKQLHKLSGESLLEVGVPEIRSAARKKYYLRSSIEPTRMFFESLTPVDELATCLCVSRTKLVRRFNLLSNESLLSIDGTSYFSPDQTSRLTSHYAKFYSADHAAEQLCTTSSQIHNWRRAKRLSAIAPGNPEYLEGQILFANEEIERVRTLRWYRNWLSNKDQRIFANEAY